MSDIDFAIIADDIMTVQAFLLRQVLSEWYQTAAWFPKDLEKYAPELAKVPRVFFVGDNVYTRHFAADVEIGWRSHGVFWGFSKRAAVILADEQPSFDAELVRELDLAVAEERKQARLQRVTNRLSPGLRAAASFFDPRMLARTTPPMQLSPDIMIQRLQYSLAVGNFLREGFDSWCWGRRITDEDETKRIRYRY